MKLLSPLVVVRFLNSAVFVCPKIRTIQGFPVFHLILIAGNVLSHDTDGETALIPAEIMRYSLEKATEVNIETSLRVLASPGDPSSSIPGHESTDPVVKLVAAVFRLSEIGKLNF